MAPAQRVVAVVQARLSSQRLPGKILRELRGQPSIDYLLDALAKTAGLDGVVLATSTDPSDDATAAHARARGLPCHRGSLTHVAERLLNAAQEQGADALVRLSGDSPLLDPALVDQAVWLFRRHTPDVVTNVYPRSFPKGQSVEVLSVAVLRRVVQQMRVAEEREHVTPFFYAHPEEFSIHSFTTDPPRAEVQLSIDSPEDFARCEEIIDQLGEPPWRAGWRACLAAYDRLRIAP